MDRLERIAKRIFADDGNGHDIDIVCRYDTSYAQELFDESFEKLGEIGQDSVYGFDWNDPDAGEVFEIIDYDAFGDAFGDDCDYRTLLYEAGPDEIAKFVMKVCTPEEVSETCLEDIKDASDLSMWIEEHDDEYSDDEDDWEYEWAVGMFPESVRDAMVDWAKSRVDMPSDEHLYSNIDDLSGCGLGMRDGYDYYNMHGYSKGDSCFVVFRTDSDVDYDTIQNIIYSAPVTCRITVDDEEYYVDSEMKDMYDYDKDEVIEIMKRMMGDEYDEEIDEYLHENLPEYPNYN